MDPAISRFLWICLGGAVGTGARHLLAGWMLQAFGTRFPLFVISAETGTGLEELRTAYRVAPLPPGLAR